MRSSWSAGGATAISHGVDAATLPADTAELREIIDRVASEPRLRRRLAPEDLPRLYAMLELFLERGELEEIRAAQGILERLGKEGTPRASEEEIIRAGLSRLQQV